MKLPANFASFVARQREQAEKLRTAHGIEAQAWYSIRNASDSDEAEVMLYDEIGGWYGATADQFIADLRGITAPNLRVRINSPGGSVFEGIAIANALRSHPGNVTVQVDSVAASIASVIAMAGDRVEMAPNSMLMIHEASGLCMGNAADMDEMARLLALISDNIADAYASRAGGTREQWREAMQAETWYLPEDAVAAGLADEALAVPKKGEPVEDPEKDEPDMARAWDLAAYGYQGPHREEPKAEAGLTEDIRGLIGEEVAAQLAASVAPAAEPVAEPEPPAPDPAPEAHTDDPTDTEEPAAEPDPADEWTALTAHLTPDDDDTWSALVSNLTEPDASSSAATA
ncbi:head maturation protease, ClpP-related [Streptomyces canus]|uniref:head maturation protease, ClpP-related n=1 Tax=Streptomyces canus TaxID=58343 RepID=UPI0038641810|nr:Clp protease ClpP [Streptomyces canus]